MRVDLKVPSTARQVCLIDHLIWWYIGYRVGLSTPKSICRDLGRFPFNQNFRKFLPKTEWNGSDQPENFRKRRSTFRGGLLFRLVRSDRKLLFHSKKFRFVVPLYRKFLEFLSETEWNGSVHLGWYNHPENLNRNFWSNGKRPWTHPHCSTKHFVPYSFNLTQGAIELLTRPTSCGPLGFIMILCNSRRRRKFFEWEGV